MKELKGFKEIIIDNHIKITIIELGDEILVSADVPALEWCYKASDELSVDDRRLLYSVLEVPEVGRVELAGYKVVDAYKLINVKFRVVDPNVVVDAYNKLIAYLKDLCGSK
mgnify:CR=1 FL=1